MAPVQVKAPTARDRAGSSFLTHNLPYGFVAFVTSNALLSYLVGSVESEQYFVFSAGQMLKKVSD